MKKKTIVLKKIQLNKDKIMNLTTQEQINVWGGDGVIKIPKTANSCRNCNSAMLTGDGQ